MSDLSDEASDESNSVLSKLYAATKAEVFGWVNEMADNMTPKAWERISPILVEAKLRGFDHRWWYQVFFK